MQVSIKELSYAYRSKRVLEKLSCEIASGEIVGVLGVNGAGKSTLFKLLCGLLPLQSGVLKYNGQVLNRRVKTQMGVVFQDCSLDPKLTCRENLMLFSALYSKAAVPTEISGLDLKARVKDLSGGMKRKLELARVFLHQPQLVFMDEPTTGLDMRSFEEFWLSLRAKKQTVILTTHKAEEAEKCDRLLILHDGKIILSESPEDFKKRVSEDQIILRMKDGSVSTTSTQEGPKVLPRLIESFAKDSVLSAEVRKPSLADAFLKVTGVALT